MLRRVGGQIPPAGAAGNRSLEGTYWKATELAGKATPAQDAKREAHLVFQTGGRVSASDGCNRITGTYELKGTALTFGQMAGTQMACIDSAAEIERAFRGALKSTMRLAIAGDRLDLFDAAGNRVRIVHRKRSGVCANECTGLRGEVVAARQIPGQRWDDADA